MPRIISVVNQKGGVGKTTTTVNIATSLAAIGKKVLVIDLDPQGNASTGFGIDQSMRKLTSYNLVINGKTADEAAIKTCIPDLSIVPSNIDLSAAEIELAGLKNREYRLKESIQNSNLEYDYVIIDCPPSLGLVTINALAASDAVLIPLQCEFYALEGLSHLLKTLQIVQQSLNPNLEIQGVILTMYDKRNKLTEHIEKDVREFLGTTVYKTVIPRNVRISEAPSYGKPAIIYDLKCAGSQSYLQLAKEMIKREKVLLAAKNKEVA